MVIMRLFAVLCAVLSNRCNAMMGEYFVGEETGKRREKSDWTISLDQLLEQQRTLLFRGFLYLKTFLE
jgi:hypothetical protein